MCRAIREVSHRIMYAFKTFRVTNSNTEPPFQTQIEVETFADVQAALDFSKATGVPLSIRNSGHDFLGRSSIPGSLALWVGILFSDIRLKWS
jgi:hypothetical protein